MNSFNHICECCSQNLDGIPHFYDRVTEYKLCLGCAKFEIRWAISSQDEKTFIPGSEDVILLDGKGQPKLKELARIVRTEGTIAARSIGRLIRVAVYGNKATKTAQEYSESIINHQLPKNQKQRKALIFAEKLLLEEQIDHALAVGDKESFKQLTSELKALEEGASHEAY